MSDIAVITSTHVRVQGNIYMSQRLVYHDAHMKTAEIAQELLVVVGLPGSGKTTYTDGLVASGQLEGYCDDYIYGPFRPECPTVSDKDIALFDAIEQGKRWAVADTRYCDPRERLKLNTVLTSRFGDLLLRYVYFENKPNRCAHNAIIRGAGDALHPLSLIYYYTALYEIPDNAEQLKIYKV